MNRNVVFDYACGLAISALVVSNSAPLLDPEMHQNLLFRMLASLPAPMLIIAACAGVAQAAHRHQFIYFLQRGIFFILLGTAIDITANKILPFQGFDMLYAAGILVPCTYIANKLKSIELAVLIVIIFAITNILQQALGYQAEPLITGLNGEIDPNLASTVIWKHWIIDGWYPIFPWIGVGFCGILFSRYFTNFETRNLFYKMLYSLSMVALMVSGTALGRLNPSPFYTRHGYVELFYPPTLSFMLIALGCVGTLLLMLEHLRKFQWSTPLLVLGKKVLLIYVVQFLVISHILAPFFFPIQSYLSLFAIVMMHIALLYVCACFSQHLAERRQTMPVMLKWLFGR